LSPVRYGNFAAWAGLIIAALWVVYRTVDGNTAHWIVMLDCLLLSCGMQGFLYFRRQRLEALRIQKIREKPCSRCGYSLIGNTTGVCPECGEAFRWVCPRCKQPIAADAPQCDKCGCEWDAQDPKSA